MLPIHWCKSLKKSPLRFKEPLSAHTTLRIGGPADIWVQPHDFEQLRKIVGWCLKQHLPYLVIGKGSNILFSDRGFRGVIICLNSCAFTKIEVKGTKIFCGPGLSLTKLLRQAKLWGLGGLEFLAGIPASIAGALVMNAGSQQKSIAHFVKTVTVLDKKGKKRALNKKQLKFAYRRSNLDKYIVLEVLLRLIKRSPKKIGENIAAHLSQKRKTQDLTAQSAGCIFKNPAHPLTAGKMIEACGLKGRGRRGAEISAKHANYIINRRKAKARDVLYLIELAQRAVNKKFGVHLEPEIKIVR